MKKGPAILIDEIGEAVVEDAAMPFIINTYGEGDQVGFIITDSNTIQSIPGWLWLLIIASVSWGVYYFIAFINA